MISFSILELDEERYLLRLHLDKFDAAVTGKQHILQALVNFIMERFDGKLVRSSLDDSYLLNIPIWKHKVTDKAA